MKASDFGGKLRVFDASKDELTRETYSAPTPVGRTMGRFPKGRLYLERSDLDFLGFNSLKKPTLVQLKS